MIAIPNERLRERAREKVMGLELAVTQTAFSDTRAELEEELEMTRIALASLEAEPVEWRVAFRLDGQPGSDFEKTFENQEKMNEIISLHERAGFSASITPLYTAPPAPESVPDEAKSRELFEKWCSVNIERNKWHPEHYAHLPAREQWAAWEACRAAMLHGAKS